MEKFRAKSFNLVLYPEDETHVQALEKIKSSYDYAYILHDQDINEDGELKKQHYHVVLSFKNAKWNTALADELGITANYIEESRSLKRSLLYLIHYYDENKFQYPVDRVFGSLKRRLETYINGEGKTESEKVIEIFEEIDSIDNYIDYTIFVKHIAKIGYWDVLRRSSFLILRYLDDHNNQIRSQN